MTSLDKTHLESCLVAFSQIELKHTLWLSDFVFGLYHKQMHMHKNAHSSFISISLKLDTTQISITV